MGRIKVHLMSDGRIVQYFAAFSASLSIITSGMHAGWPSPSLPQLTNLPRNSTLHLNSGDIGSWLAVAPLIGGVIGSIIAGLSVDHTGRKMMIILTSIPFTIAWFMVAYASNFAIMGGARFLAGIADGCAFTAVPMYVAEIAEAQIRGMLGTSIACLWILGVLLISVIGSYCTIKITALLSSILPIVTFIIMLTTPKSPYYCAMRKQIDESRKSLKQIRKHKDETVIENELQRIVDGIKASATRGSFFDLFRVRRYRYATFIMLGLRTFQQLSGTTAILFYTVTIFKGMGDTISPTLATSIYFTVQLICAAFCSLLVDRAGRRVLLLISISGSACALALEGTYFYLKYCKDWNMEGWEWVPVLGLVSFVVVFSVGLYPIPILIMSELFPTQVKAFAVCLCDFVFCVMAIVTSKLFQWLNDGYGIFLPFYVFMGSCLVGVVFVWTVVPETKGKTLEEIQYELGRRENARNSRNERNSADV